MEKSILNFPKQFAFRPKIENAKNLRPAENFIVAGMGGSALAAELLKTAHPELNLIVWKSYDLPSVRRSLGAGNPSKTYHLKPNTLLVASSYSGSTKETLSAFESARKRKLNIAVLTVGGKLLALAKKYKVPYIQMPETGIQPRMSAGLNLVSLAQFIGLKDQPQIHSLAKSLKPEIWRAKGKALSENLWDQVPVIYSSAQNFPIAMNWKIKFNENAKIPSFANFFPELNHNEMTGFDVKKTTANLSSNLHLIFLEDGADHPRIKRRFAVTKKLLTEKGINLSEIPISGKNTWEKIFSSTLLADWTSFYLAKYYGVDPEQVPMVETLKKLIR
ncbi:MAG: hypothetical protein HY093_05035 [Candidatus Liptonbacteria bacterium]|nr:hypothetical protein [Candidatus Liptonbacteria bacterium]